MASQHGPSGVSVNKALPSPYLASYTPPHTPQLSPATPRTTSPQISRLPPPPQPVFPPSPPTDRSMYERPVTLMSVEQRRTHSAPDSGMRSSAPQVGKSARDDLAMASHVKKASWVSKLFGGGPTSPTKPKGRKKLSKTEFVATAARAAADEQGRQHRQKQAASRRPPESGAKGYEADARHGASASAPPMRYDQRTMSYDRAPSPQRSAQAPHAALMHDPRQPRPPSASLPSASFGLPHHLHNPQASSSREALPSLPSDSTVRLSYTQEPIVNREQSSTKPHSQRSSLELYRPDSGTLGREQAPDPALRDVPPQHLSDYRQSTRPSRPPPGQRGPPLRASAYPPPVARQQINEPYQPPQPQPRSSSPAAQQHRSSASAPSWAAPQGPRVMPSATPVRAAQLGRAEEAPRRIEGAPPAMQAARPPSMATATTPIAGHAAPFHRQQPDSPRQQQHRQSMQTQTQPQTQPQPQPQQQPQQQHQRFSTVASPQGPSTDEIDQDPRFSLLPPRRRESLLPAVSAAQAVEAREWQRQSHVPSPSEAYMRQKRSSSLSPSVPPVEAFRAAPASPHQQQHRPSPSAPTPHRPQPSTSNMQQHRSFPSAPPVQTHHHPAPSTSQQPYRPVSQQAPRSPQHPQQPPQHGGRHFQQRSIHFMGTSVSHDRPAASAPKPMSTMPENEVAEPPPKSLASLSSYQPPKPSRLDGISLRDIEGPDAVPEGMVLVPKGVQRLMGSMRRKGSYRRVAGPGARWKRRSITEASLADRRRSTMSIDGGTAGDDWAI